MYNLASLEMAGAEHQDFEDCCGGTLLSLEPSAQAGQV